jgi:uncharacterized membrane protein
MIEGHLHEWLDLALRWIHVIVGIAWIGTSFYFNWLNNHIRPTDSPEPGVAGELWSVHGGGFYRVVKYGVAPERLPTKLHWFKWEAYSTWVSGISLLFVVYYLGPSGITVDPDRWDLPRWGAMLFGIGSLVAGWFVYDTLCRLLGRRPVALAIVGYTLLVAVAFGYSQVLTGRAAYIHTGALIGTLMAANVFRVIIPAQRAMVDAMTRGETPDSRPGENAARRSLHNNYLTLPVVFIMVSPHFPSTFGGEANWALLAGLMLVGAGVRHWFNLRGQGHRNVWILPAAVLAMLALAVVAAPAEVSDDAVPDDVWTIVQARCTPCHSESPTQPRVADPPKGIVFDRKSDLAARASQVAEVVASGLMPRNNATLMTDEERARVVAWARGG